ncbi:MAG: NAD(P)/FAD-dependent oxidoreductase, partial [Thermomicrobiaceae bacterium]|nr:NAD(P)/FAD-dependent oxidoreductase [Thermomicrobiaceae bacterium]
MGGLAADVIVVGGGPAGSATATHLARRGYDVLLLDRAAFPREKPCGEYLSPGVIDALARLGALDAVRAASPAWPEGMLIVAPRASFALRYPDGAGPRRALGVPRVVLDRLLLDHARAAGARVRERARVTGVVREGGRVVGVQVRVGQETVTLRSRFVVGADGVHSTVSRALGLDLPTRWPRRLGLVARYEGASLGPTAEMHASRRAYCGIAPVGPDLVCVGLVVPLGDKPEGERTADYFERRIRALPGAARALADARRVTPIRGVGPIARRVRRVSGPGFLLVGDAAGFLDPFTGEGVFRALRGAE